MIVVAHGDVDRYCSEHDMVIGERYEGDLRGYKGCCPLVTDADIAKNEYFYIKYKMLLRKVQIISTRWASVELAEFVAYCAEQESKHRKERGRVMFGCRRLGGMIVDDPAGMRVVNRIFELRDSGATYERIRNDEGVHHLDGRKMSISTIQVILGNRDKYGK